MKTIPKFLIAGGLASSVNWLARFGFSLFLPFVEAVVAAYIVGMLVGFVLYRNWVFSSTTARVGRQIAAFVVINLFGLGAVALSAVVLAHLLVLTGFVRDRVAEGAGHLAAIALGAVINYLGHRTITFAGAIAGKQR